MNDENNVKRVIPMIMLVFISSATMISVINIISPQLTVDFGISPTTVSLLSMTVMLMMGVASVAYSTLSDYLSIRRLMIFGVCLLDVGAVMGFLAAGRSFYMLLGASALMITGGTCGSGLMIRMVVCVPDSTGLAGSPSVHMQVCAGRKAESGGQAGYCGAGAVGGVHLPHIHVF